MQTRDLPTPTMVDRGDLAGNAQSFALHLRATNKARRTQQTYLEAVNGFRRFLAAAGMPLDIANIKREHVEAWMEKLLAESKASTAVNRYRSLQQFFRWAIDEGEITVSPMARTKPPKNNDQSTPVLTEPELRRLLATVAGTDFDERRDAAIIRTFIGSGIRLAELTGLTADALDLNLATIDVLGKGGRHRTAHVGAKAARALDRYSRVRSRHAHADSPALWLGERGAMTVSGIAQVIRRRGDQADIVGLHPHMLRHSWAHGVLSAGMTESDVMALAGWRSSEMLRRYARVTASDRAIASSRLLNPGDRL